MTPMTRPIAGEQEPSQVGRAAGDHAEAEAGGQEERSPGGARGSGGGCALLERWSAGDLRHEQHRAHRHHGDDAAEDPPPADRVGHRGGDGGPDQPGDDEHRRDGAEHQRSQPERHVPGDDHQLEAHRAAGAEALEEAPERDGLHRGGQGCGEKAHREQHEGEHERPQRAPAVGEAAAERGGQHGGHEWSGDGPPVGADAAHVVEHGRHGGGRADDLEGVGAEQQDEPDGQRPQVGTEQLTPAGTLVGGPGGRDRGGRVRGHLSSCGGAAPPSATGLSVQQSVAKRVGPMVSVV